MQTTLIIKKNDNQDSWNTAQPDAPAGHQDLQISFSELHNLPLQPISEIYQSWLQLYETDPRSDLQQHPDHVARLVPIFREMYPQLPGYLMQCRREGILVAVGILFPKYISTKTLKAIGPATRLPGYCLGGNGFLLEPQLQQDDAFLKKLLDSAVNFCQQQQASFLLLEDLLIDNPL
ncbi:MAG: hypothetical protein KDA77_13695, partial [Planctomycetaceae bacterium]|nr:hypothetical protein [Planctomycetaceae bacterium]